MNDFIMFVLNIATYLSAILIIVVGCLLTVSALLYPVWYLFDKVLYPRFKGSYYFIKYMRNHKEFQEWYKNKESNFLKERVGRK